MVSDVATVETHVVAALAVSCKRAEDGDSAVIVGQRFVGVAFQADMDWAVGNRSCELVAAKDVDSKRLWILGVAGEPLDWKRLLPVAVAVVVGIVVLRAAGSNAGWDGSLAAVDLEAEIVVVVGGSLVAAVGTDDMVMQSSHTVDWEPAEVAERHAQCKEEERGFEVVDEVGDWHRRCSNSGRPYLQSIQQIDKFLSHRNLYWVCNKEFTFEKEVKIRSWWQVYMTGARASSAGGSGAVAGTFYIYLRHAVFYLQYDFHVIHHLSVSELLRRHWSDQLACHSLRGPCLIRSGRLRV